MRGSVWFVSGFSDEGGRERRLETEARLSFRSAFSWKAVGALRAMGAGAVRGRVVVKAERLREVEPCAWFVVWLARCLGVLSSRDGVVASGSLRVEKLQLAVAQV